MFLKDMQIFRAPEDGTGSGTFFSETPGEPAGEKPAGEGAPAGEQKPALAGEKPAAERPDWLLPKYNSPEDQAKAYNDLFRSYSKKTDDLRKEVLETAVKEYGKTVGVPEKPEDYAYPEGFQAPGEPVDKALRSWAQKHNVSPDGFKELVKDVHGLTVAKAEDEMKALGDNAEDRIRDVNQWVNKNVDKAHFKEVARIMTTAGGIALLESLMDGKSESGFSPGDDGGDQQPLTRNGIRNMQADPRFGVDKDYTAMVRARWAAYVKLPADRQV